MNQLLNDQKTAPLTSVSLAGRTEEALRLVGYVDPATRSVSHQEWDAIQASIDKARKITPPVCRGCEGALLPGQPEGAYCKGCAQIQSEIYLDDHDEDEARGGALACAFLIGVGAIVGFLLRCAL